MPRAERKDSVRNREALVATARRVLMAEGLNAPMDRIATAAGVGAGTLYRHFPTRLALWEAVLEEPLRQQLALLEEAAAATDRWAGLSGYILASCALEAEQGGFLNLMTARFEGAPALLAIRAQLQDGIVGLITRAREAGVIRADFTPEDLIFIMLSNSKVAEVTRAVAPRAWRRNAELFLDSIRPERAHPLSEPPMRPGQVYRSMMPPLRGRGRTS